MNKSLIILGSTGSIGSTTIKSIENQKNFKVILLTAGQNIKKLLSQSIKFKAKHAIIENKKKYDKFKNLFHKNRISLHHGFNNINNILKDIKVNYCINSISGINGLDPTLKLIPHTKKFLIANKESIICAWNLIQKKLKKNNTEFIPIDSEHFSIWELIKNENKNAIDRIVLTASGGPFLKKKN